VDVPLFLCKKEGKSYLCGKQTASGEGIFQFAEVNVFLDQFEDLL
jgi:hypothetical protein